MRDERDQQPDHLSERAHGPGAPSAVDRGCTCSVLANAAFRAGAPDERPFVDPDCLVHSSAP